MKLMPGSYDNGTTVDNEAEILASFQHRSREVYQKFNFDGDIPYGELPRQTIDWLYSPHSVVGTLIFIHGGYWQFCNKEDFAFIAAVPLALGLDVVLVEYSHAPQATLTDIDGEIGAALSEIQRRLAQRPPCGPVYLAGHSAGGQLVARWQQHPLADAVFPISGIFELEPLLSTYVNHRLQLTAAEIAVLSPARHIPARLTPMTLFYGAQELPELIGQSEHYCQALRQQGLSVGLQAVVGANHYNVLDALFAADGALIHLLQQGEDGR